MVRSDDEATTTTTTRKLPEFPGEHPQQHSFRDWLETFNDEVAMRRLQPTLRGEMPFRVQGLRNWPADLTSVPAAVASRLDAAALFKARGDAAMRLKENEKNNLSIKLATLTDSTELFTLITESMVRTAPLLRDNLRNACKIPHSEFYDGKKAYDAVIAHVQALAREGTDADYYQSAEELMRKASNRLPTGCTASEFATRVRNFVHRINPNLDRPYVGEAIGKFIINLMPLAYEEAGERVLADLKRRGKLADAAEVSRECLTVVNKRARQNTKMTAAFALGETHTPSGEPQLPANTNTRRKPDDWTPDLKTEFCPGCPHEGADCYSDPRKVPNLPDSILRRHALYDRIAKRRDENAKKMKLKAKPMPPKKPPKAAKDKALAAGEEGESDQGGGTMGSTAAATGEVQAPAMQDDWFTGLMELTQLPMIDSSITKSTRKSTRLAGVDPNASSSSEPPPPSAGSSSKTTTDEPIKSADSLPSPNPGSDRFFVVYQGRATGVAACDFNQLRSTYLRGHQDPVYEEYDTLEAANDAWNEYKQQQLREPPPLIASHRVQQDTSTASIRELVEAIGQPPTLSLALMSFEAPVMNTEEQISASDNSTPAAVSGAVDKPRGPRTGKHQLGSTWTMYQRLRNATVRPRELDVEPQNANVTADNEPMTPTPTTDDTEAMSQLMGAAVGWIVLLLTLIPLAYLIGAGVVSMTRTGVIILIAAIAVASSAASIATNASGVDGLIRASSEILTAAASALGQLSQRPGTLTPWIILMSAMVMFSLCNSDTASQHRPTDRDSNQAPTSPLQRLNQAPTSPLQRRPVVAMALSDQGIFDLVTPDEAHGLLTEISLLHRGSRILVLGDSCAASGVGNRADQFLPDTLHDSPTVVSTAGGSITCHQRGTLAIKIRTNRGHMVLTVENAILNPSCPYVLVPVGRLSHTKGVEVHMPAWGKDGYFQYPDGVRIRMVNKNVWVIADFPDLQMDGASSTDQVVAAPVGVVQGKHLANHTVGGRLIHAAWAHQSCDRLKWLHHTLHDVPERWGAIAAAEDGPCDVCLRAVARKQAGSGHFPSDGGLIAFDVWHCSIPFVHGRQRLVIGFVHVLSGRTKSYLMRRHTDGPKCIQEAHVYFSSLGITVTWMHTDGAMTLIQEEKVAAFLRERNVRRTTRTPGYSRQNPMEPRWSPLREACRKNLVQSRLPSEWWAYAWVDGEEALALTPSRDPPHHCPHHIATGYKAKGGHRRPFGCLAYVPHPGRTDKVGDKGGGVPGILIGYALELEPNDKPPAPCYHIWCPSLGRIVRESTVRMVPHVFPGLDPVYFPRLAGGELAEPPTQQTSSTLLPETDPYVDASKLAEFDTTLEFRRYEGDFRLPSAPSTGHPLLDGEDVEWDQRAVNQRSNNATRNQTANAGEMAEAVEGGAGERQGDTVARRLAQRRALEQHPHSRRTRVAAAIEAMQHRIEATAAVACETDSMELDEWQFAALNTMIEADEAYDNPKIHEDKRKEYAALSVLAATHGVELPPYEMSYTRVGDNSAIPERDIWKGELDGCLLSCTGFDKHVPTELTFACKSKADPDTYTERQCRTSRFAKEFEHAGWEEIANLDRFKAVERVTRHDPRVVQYLAQGKRIIDTMMLGKIKRNDRHEVEKFKGRCVLRGDQMTDLSANATFSPALAESDFNCVEAVKVMRGMNEETFDAVGAYLQGNRNESEVVIARSPRHYREYDEDGEELLWILTVPLYGQADAGAIWNRTWDEHMRGPVEGYATDEAAPCLYARVVGPNLDERVHVPVYVDDGKICSDSSPAATAEHTRLKTSLCSRFQIQFKEGLNPEHTLFLAKNVHRRSATCTSISGRTYIEKIAARYLDAKMDTYPKAWKVMPADKTLEQLFISATRQRPEPDKNAQAELRARVGAIGYIVPQRPDVAYPWNILASCIVMATEEFVKAANRVIVYLLATKDLPITYSRSTPGAHKLIGRADANFSVHRSTSGRVIMYAGATVMHRAQKQHCIAMSTCEAELMALSSLALDMLYIQRVLHHLGVEFDDEPVASTTDPEAHALINRVKTAWAGTPLVETDSKSAHDLCHRNSAGPSTRHVERRAFKMRELNRTKKVKVGLVPTHLMYADILTKVLDVQAFRRCRSALMNLEAVGM